MIAPGPKHLLDQLQLPTRYEPLINALGGDRPSEDERLRVGSNRMVRLLVTPDRATLHALEDAADSVASMGEGLFVPLYAASGTGKTTLASHLDGFLPARFAPTLTYDGDITVDSMSQAVAKHHQARGRTDQRVLPVNLEHREGRPATAAEQAEIKRFLRAGAGSRALLLWPTTERAIAEQMSRQSTAISGAIPIELPLRVQGPPAETWKELTRQTLALTNQVDDLDDLIEPFPVEGDLQVKGDTPMAVR